MYTVKSSDLLRGLSQKRWNKGLKRIDIKKKRGNYLFGPAATGKTTIVIKKFLNEDYYQKAMLTTTYDAYSYENSILYVEMNPKNSKIHLA